MSGIGQTAAREATTFTAGDLVRTIKGAAYEGIALAIYEKIDGSLNASVEAVDAKFAGTVHVYPVGQLMLVDRGALYAMRLARNHKGNVT